MKNVCQSAGTKTLLKLLHMIIFEGYSGTGVNTLGKTFPRNYFWQVLTWELPLETTFPGNCLRENLSWEHAGSTPGLGVTRLGTNYPGNYLRENLSQELPLGKPIPRITSGNKLARDYLR